MYDNGPICEGFDGKIWQVHKFGGTSVANAECFEKVVSIIEQQIVRDTDTNDDEDDVSDNVHRVAVVVSAMGGKPKVTDLLLSAVAAAADRDEEGVDVALRTVLEKHTRCIRELFPHDGSGSSGDNDDDNHSIENIGNPIAQRIHGDISDIRDILKTVSLMKWQATRISELVSGYGETWSTQILAELLTARSDRRNGRYQTPPTEMERSNPTLLDNAYVQGSSQHVAKERFAYLDARNVITIDEEVIKDGSICWDISANKLHQQYQQILATNTATNTHHRQHLVMTGYVCSNTKGVSSTLQRDGSDYSASILGRLLQSTSITIWTDVSGVLSADPRRVPDSYVLPEVSYNEAMELAYFGAKVIHPKTMRPAIQMAPMQIPIFIRNTFRPDDRGTRIFTSSTTTAERDRCVCGFSTMENMAIVNVEGSGMVGVRGVARRLFQVLETIGVNVALISQASSEHSITFATEMVQAEGAKTAIEEEFHKEILENHISEIEIVSPCSIIAAVGDGMHLTTGVAGRFFSALGDAKINVLAISQGSNERNISAVILESESTKALRVVHAAFRLSHSVVKVGLVGMNDIGKSLLKLLESERDKLLGIFEIDLQVCAVLKDGGCDDIVVLRKDSGTVDRSEGGRDESITMDGYNAAMATSGTVGGSVPPSTLPNQAVGLTSGGLQSYISTITSEDNPHTVVFDCTADASVGELHINWLRAGLNVVTANNSALSGPKEIRDAIKKVEESKKAKYLREVTVGGGLPVISTLRNLLSSGDQIRRIDGIFSVTMSYLMHRIAPPIGLGECNEFDMKVGLGAYRGDADQSGAPAGRNMELCSFSEAVKEAIALGLTEVDPIKDLSNEYTARCLMVLAKELGLDDDFDIKKIQCASESLISGMPHDVEHYNSELEAYLDAKMKKRVTEASAKGCVPRHVSVVDARTGTISINIVDVPRNHVFATTPPSCECVRFFTERHKRYPLIVQGPSAGADSTASALLAELLNLMRTKIGTRPGVLSRTSTSLYLA